MAEVNTIYDLEGNIVGIFRFGIAWKKEPKKRLGKYDDHFIYSNESKKLAEISENRVIDLNGSILGEIRNNELYISNEKVGKFVGDKSAGAAAIVFLFN